MWLWIWLTERTKEASKKKPWLYRVTVGLGVMVKWGVSENFIKNFTESEEWIDVFTEMLIMMPLPGGWFLTKGVRFWHDLDVPMLL